MLRVRLINIALWKSHLALGRGPASRTLCLAMVPQDRVAKNGAAEGNHFNPLPRALLSSNGNCKSWA